VTRSIGHKPESHICSDKAVRYEHVLLMTEAQQAGLKKIGFVADPVK